MALGWPTTGTTVSGSSSYGRGWGTNSIFTGIGVSDRGRLGMRRQGVGVRAQVAVEVARGAESRRGVAGRG